MNDNIKNEHDLGYKHILSHKQTFIEFLREFIKKDWVQLIKEENLVLIDKEFILEDFKEEEADIVYKVNIEGKDIIFYILLELQSKVDFRMPIRLLMYMTEIWRDELKNTEDIIKRRKDYKLPAIVPIVLYNGKNKWTAARDFKEILNGYELFDENIINFRYMLYDINRMDENELFEIANLISSVFLLDQDVEMKEIIKRLKLIGRMIKMNSTKEQQNVFKGWLINIFKNRFGEEVREYIYKVLSETRDMEVDNMVSNLGKNLEKEFKTARQEGIKEGMEKGIKEGVINTAKKFLKLGVDIELIKQATNLSDEEIMNLKEEIDKEKN